MCLLRKISLVFLMLISILLVDVPPVLGISWRDYPTDKVDIFVKEVRKGVRHIMLCKHGDEWLLGNIGP